MENDKKVINNFMLVLLSVVGVPFLGTLFKFFKKGAKEPVLMCDLLALLGLQIMAAAAAAVYFAYFYNATAVLK